MRNNFKTKSERNLSESLIRLSFPPFYLILDSLTLPLFLSLSLSLCFALFLFFFFHSFAGPREIEHNLFALKKGKKK